VQQQLLVEGDEWHPLPHVASAELRDALERLISSSDEEAVHIAADVINTLGAQGFLVFRSLLDSRRVSQPSPPGDVMTVSQSAV
jgi:hypothetical protein